MRSIPLSLRTYTRPHTGTYQIIHTIYLIYDYVYVYILSVIMYMDVYIWSVFIYVYEYILSVIIFVYVYILSMTMYLVY